MGSSSNGIVTCCSPKVGQLSSRRSDGFRSVSICAWKSTSEGLSLLGAGLNSPFQSIACQRIFGSSQLIIRCQRERSGEAEVMAGGSLDCAADRYIASLNSPQSNSTQGSFPTGAVLEPPNAHEISRGECCVTGLASCTMMGCTHHLTILHDLKCSLLLHTMCVGV